MQACSNPYGTDHVVQAYETIDLMSWVYLGVALPLSARAPGIEFRPCVVFNAATQLYVMWYEDRHPYTAGSGSEWKHARDQSTDSGYSIAVSTTPGGPFTTTHTNIAMPGSGRIGDFNIFVDDDGSAYHVRTGFDVVKLNANYTGPETHVSAFSTPKASEGPTMFKRNGTYYVTAGSGCCACIGGSSIYVLSAPKPSGPWTYRGDVGSNPTPFDPHSPNNYVTKVSRCAVPSPPCLACTRRALAVPPSHHDLTSHHIVHLSRHFAPTGPRKRHISAGWQRAHWSDGLAGQSVE